MSWNPHKLRWTQYGVWICYLGRFALKDGEVFVFKNRTEAEAQVAKWEKDFPAQKDDFIVSTIPESPLNRNGICTKAEAEARRIHWARMKAVEKAKPLP